MLPDNATILVCPYCGGEKEVLSLMSGNRFGGRRWWDWKEDYPMLPHVSYVQKCPHCGMYYMLYSAKKKKGTDESFELGHLSYQEMREALAQFTEMDLKSENLFLEYIWAFNDAFQRDGVDHELSSPTDEELTEFQGVVREWVAALSHEVDFRRIWIAELLCEARFFDEALSVINQVGEQTDSMNQLHTRIIREKALNHDSSVGIKPE